VPKDPSFDCGRQLGCHRCNANGLSALRGSNDQRHLQRLPPCGTQSFPRSGRMYLKQASAREKATVRGLIPFDTSLGSGAVNKLHDGEDQGHDPMRYAGTFLGTLPHKTTHSRALCLAAFTCSRVSIRAGRAVRLYKLSLRLASHCEMAGMRSRQSIFRVGSFYSPARL